MPGHRGENLKLVNLYIDSDALKELDASVTKAEYPDRSKFIRDAIGEKLEAMGYPVPSKLFYVPTRMGKGGRPRLPKRYPPPSAPWSVNDGG